MAGYCLTLTTQRVLFTLNATAVILTAVLFMYTTHKLRLSRAYGCVPTGDITHPMVWSTTVTMGSDVY